MDESFVQNDVDTSETVVCLFRDALTVGRSKSSVGRLLQLYRSKDEPHPDEDDCEEPAVSPSAKVSEHDEEPGVENEQSDAVSSQTDGSVTDQGEEIAEGSTLERVGEEKVRPPKRIVPYDFPGWEQYDSALRDPRLVVTKGMKKAAAKLLKRERSIIQAAAVLANRLYVETGVSIPISDSIRLSEFRRQQGIEFADSS